jgi:hypothetical protein
MSGELIVGSIMVMGFAIGAAIWARCERYVRTGKGIIMILCTGTTWISGSCFQDIRAEEVVTGLVVIAVLSALLGVPFCEGFLRVYRMCKKNRGATGRARLINEGPGEIRSASRQKGNCEWTR